MKVTLHSGRNAAEPLRTLHRNAKLLAMPMTATVSQLRAPLGDGVGLCADCWSRLSLIEPPYCARLGIPFTYDPGPGLLSMKAIADPPAYYRARAAERYDDVARALVLSFKDGDRLDLAAMMGRWMARAGRELTADADALLPVPLHWRRLWARRFNQSAALAGAIADICGVPVLHGALKRVRATPQQVGLSKSERTDNVSRHLPRAGRRKGPCGRPPAGAGRRRAHLRRYGRHLRPRPAAGWCRPCRRAGVRPGCRSRAHSHITEAATIIVRPCPLSKSIPPAIAPIATRPRLC
jgi:predicted amidophosphoribosyltransferase